MKLLQCYNFVIICATSYVIDLRLLYLPIVALYKNEEKQNV